jgi:hypothetical protein
LHESLIASEADFAAARSGYVEIGFAYQQRAEFGFAECAEELCESAMRYVEFQRFLIMAAHIYRDIALGNFGESGVEAPHLRRGLPSTPSPTAANSCFDQSRKACLTSALAFSLPSSERSALSTGTRTWAWMRVLSRSDNLGSTK